MTLSLRAFGVRRPHPASLRDDPLSPEEREGPPLGADNGVVEPVELIVFSDYV